MTGFSGSCPEWICCICIRRQLIGTNHQNVLLVTALLGGLLVTLVDLVGRAVFAPIELSWGVVTAAIGAPFFLYLLIRIDQSKST